MTLRHLNTFVAVCEYGTMTKAAEGLHIAQPAISATISELEKYYEIRLFDRINQRLVITDAGKELLIKAKAVITAFKDFETLARKGKEDPTVRIGATLTIGTILIPKLLSILHSDHPDLVLQIRISNAPELEEALLAGEIDFAMIEGDVTSLNLTKIIFDEDRLAVICGKKSEIPDSVTISDLLTNPMIVREKGSASRDLFDRILTDNHLSYHPLIESNSNEAILSAARENLGIAVLPFGLVKNDLNEGSLKEIIVEKVSMKRAFYFVKYKNKRFSKAQQTAFEICSKYH